MDVAIGTLDDEVLKDEENLVRPRMYSHYTSEQCPEWVRGLLPAPVENGSRWPTIGAGCMKPSPKEKSEN
jgi:hypothetical protein